MKKYNRIITFGTFDLLHQGHINIFNRCRELSDYVIVGVSSDELCREKNKPQIFQKLEQRLLVVDNLKQVDETFVEETLEKRDYILKYNANCLLMGDDWTNKFDYVKDICDIIYVPRTEDISSTDIRYEILGYRKV